jgi:hypothetical protein
VADGRLAAGVVSGTTVARLYRDAGLERGVKVDGHTRLRWQADHAGALWHGDVCHGPTLRIGATTRPLRIHRLEIEPLVPDDTAEYLRLRLRQAGCDREFFATDAVGLLHEATAGAMRDLDRLAAAALRETAKKKRKLVERDVVARVIESDTRER